MRKQTSKDLETIDIVGQFREWFFGTKTIQYNTASFFDYKGMIPIAMNEIAMNEIVLSKIIEKKRSQIKKLHINHIGNRWRL